MLTFSLLGSGSSGNATYVASAGTRVLIDSGLSFKRLALRMAEIGAAPERLDAVLVTHEHGDHVKGLGILARKTGVTVYCTAATHEHLSPSIGELPEVRHFESGDTFSIGDLKINSFGISHDAADPVSFSVECNGAKLGLATDLGKVSHPVLRGLRASQTLVLEANHCPDMLRRGSYPPIIQQRIRGSQGHLSNQDMCSLLAALKHDALHRVVLIHLSKENNSAELVRRMAGQVLNGHGAEIIIAAQDAVTPLYEVGPP